MVILALFFLFLQNSSAKDVFSISKPTPSVVSLSLVSLYQSKQIYRGAVLWPDPVMTVLPSLTLFDHIEFKGGVGYRLFPRRDSRVVIFTLRPFTDRFQMIKFTGHKRDENNARKFSLEAQVRLGYRFGWRNLFETGIDLGQELIQYQGYFLGPYVQIPVAPFTSVRSQISYAHPTTNHYLYGAGSTGGIGYHHTRLTFVWPFLPWKGVVVLSGNFSALFKNQNKNAALVQNRHQQAWVDLLLVWNFYRLPKDSNSKQEKLQAALSL
ncbi:MAG: hypothetical protein CL678_07140 [Bdellovibrionaceae bacterium]|nr:hypothetical protein [Pseudobdellovibrionaceae bacterium]|tara:strand:- start:2832 stop:3632 length:801 start_codon:yes stop_codon:yes gene_type:complete